MVPKIRVFIKKYKKVADVVFIDYEDKYVRCKVAFEENEIPHEMEFTFDEVEFMRKSHLRESRTTKAPRF
ncbi:hypothetical protein AB6M97_06215 [Streptococcus hillyeri]|uniref:hypothetical protein n=1 Tax=Streptococcus hillyeri TaxID=2282420 RepID=UPI0034E2B583